MAQVELNIINISDIDGQLEMIQTWLNQWRDQLDFISENEGCNDAINLWTIRGEEQIIDLIIKHLPESVRNLPIPIH